MKHLVYQHKNKINNKVYIGQTYHIDNPKKRWGKNGIGYKNQPFYKAIQKYGWENFEHIILETNIEDEKIQEREDYWINFFDSMNPKKGYNRNNSTKLSEETKKIMSENWHKCHNKNKHSQLMTKYNKTQKKYLKGINHPWYGHIDSPRSRKVQCIETGEIFNSLTEASKWCNPNGSNLKSHIAKQIQGKRKSCGKHPELKIPLHWRYID